MLFLSSHAVVNAFLNPYSGLTPAFKVFYLLSLPLSNCHVFLTSLSPFLVSFSHERLHAVFDIALRGKAPLGNPERNQIQFTSVMRYILIFLDIPCKKRLQNTVSKLPVPLYPIQDATFLSLFISFLTPHVLSGSTLKMIIKAVLRTSCFMYNICQKQCNFGLTIKCLFSRGKNSSCKFTKCKHVFVT